MSNIHIINTCKTLSLIQSEQGHRQHLVSLRRDRTLYKEPGFPALERERRSFAVSASSSSVSARRLFQPARRLFQQARRLFQLVVCFSSSSVSARRLFQLARRLFQQARRLFQLVVCFSSSSVSARRLFQLARRLFQLVVCFSKRVVCFSSSSVLARRLFQLVLVVCFSKLVVCFSKLVVCVSARRLFQQARRLFQPARCLFKQARRLFKLVVFPIHLVDHILFIRLSSRTTGSFSVNYHHGETLQISTFIQHFTCSDLHHLSLLCNDSVTDLCRAPHARHTTRSGGGTLTFL
ncbi:hypothetical protein Bbelb_293300 [Branchiostoma belcheri]|nr:hypothetical protein Bbelb_293300 [Branchiostoma belcheri]